MTIDVKVITQAQRTFLKAEGGKLKVYLKAPAVDGKANKALVEFLAEHFSVKKSAVEIIKGLKSQYKTININDDKTQP